jgi:hypothetical protein
VHARVCFEKISYADIDKASQFSYDRGKIVRNVVKRGTLRAAYFVHNCSEHSDKQCLKNIQQKC